MKIKTTLGLHLTSQKLSLQKQNHQILMQLIKKSKPCTLLLTMKITPDTLEIRVKVIPATKIFVLKRCLSG